MRKQWTLLLDLLTLIDGTFTITQDLPQFLSSHAIRLSSVQPLGHAFNDQGPARRLPSGTLAASVFAGTAEGGAGLSTISSGARRYAASSRLYGMKNSSNKKTSAAIIRPRVYLGDGVAIGPGKIDLLRAVRRSRSISAAAKSLQMSYKRAWLLIDTLNRGFGRAVVETATGGRGGGGARLTGLGEQLVSRYEALEGCINSVAEKELKNLLELID